MSLVRTGFVSAPRRRLVTHRIYVASPEATPTRIARPRRTISIGTPGELPLLGRNSRQRSAHLRRPHRRRRRLYAFNLGEPLGESCTASVVDLETAAPVAEIALPGRPRWALYDEQRDRVYANVRDPTQIVVIDPERNRIERTIDIPSVGPHGLWLDSGRLFCAADGGELIVLDATTGGLLAALPLPGAPDVVMNDPERGRLYVAIGEPGLACSFDTTRLEPIETVETEPGAHTTVWDPPGRRLYVFCPASCGAAIYEDRG